MGKLIMLVAVFTAGYSPQSVPMFITSSRGEGRHGKRHSKSYEAR